jgi:hypothetical protein
MGTKELALDPSVVHRHGPFAEFADWHLCIFGAEMLVLGSP